MQLAWTDVLSRNNRNRFKKAMKEVADEEDRSKNLVVFGLVEEEGEDLESGEEALFSFPGDR